MVYPDTKKSTLPFLLSPFSLSFLESCLVTLAMVEFSWLSVFGSLKIPIQRKSLEISTLFDIWSWWWEPLLFTQDGSTMNSFQSHGMFLALAMVTPPPKKKPKKLRDASIRSEWTPNGFELQINSISSTPTKWSLLSSLVFLRWLLVHFFLFRYFPQVFEYPLLEKLRWHAFWMAPPANLFLLYFRIYVHPNYRKVVHCLGIRKRHCCSPLYHRTNDRSSPTNGFNLRKTLVGSRIPIKFAIHTPHDSSPLHSLDVAHQTHHSLVPNASQPLKSVRSLT